MTETIWGRVYNRELGKGADHGHAAFMADAAEKRVRPATALSSFADSMVEDIQTAIDEDIIQEAREDGWTESDIENMRATLTKGRE